MSTIATDLLSQIRFGNAFEALFSGTHGTTRPRPTSCTGCDGKLDELTAAFVVSEFPVARAYRIVAAYDRPSCLPDRFAALRESWSGERWIAINEDTGEEILAHPLAVRVLDAIDEAVMLLAPEQRGDRELIATLRGYFDADAETLLDAPWARQMDTTTIAFESGYAVSLASIFQGHRAHYESNAGSDDPTLPPYPTRGERLRCFFEESALTREDA